MKDRLGKVSQLRKTISTQLPCRGDRYTTSTRARDPDYHESPLLWKQDGSYVKDIT